MARPAEHFCTSPGSYFHGMVAKAKAGELNLVRTIWGLRQVKMLKSGRAGETWLRRSMLRRLASYRRGRPSTR